MTDELTAMKQQIVAAVQQQLTDYSEQVRSTVQSLRDEIAAERSDRLASDDQIRALATGLEKAQRSNVAFQTELQRALEERLSEFGATNKRRYDEMNARLDKVVDDANTGLSASVESVTRPILRDLEHRQSKVESDVGALDVGLRRFDEQAARMVTHINEVTGNVDSRIEHLAVEVSGAVDSRVNGLVARLDEVSAQSARQQTDVSNLVGKHVEEAESRLSDRIITLESRINDDVGTRIAEIDAYVGRVSVGLDEGIVMLNDRFNEVNGRFESTAAQIAAMHQSLKDVDVEALDELKERVTGAVGEVELLRIEMERFQKSMGESMDTNAIRLTELETQMQDQALDTEAAVQLERLEEVERALIALDPAQFVRVDDVNNGRSPMAEHAGPLNGTDSNHHAAAAQPLGNESDPAFTMASPIEEDPLASFAPPAGS